MSTMRVTAATHGEMSVGIRPQQYDFEFDPVLIDGDDEMREHIREAFGDFIKNLLDEEPWIVTFSDECRNCGSRLVKGHCENPCCMSSQVLSEMDEQAAQEVAGMDQELDGDVLN